MNQAEQSARIIGAETRNEMNAKAIYDLQQEVMEQAERIEKLEERTRHVAYMETARIQDIEFVKMLYSTVVTQTKRITALDQRAAEAAEDISRLTVFTGGIGNLRNTISLQADRIEKLEAVLVAATAYRKGTDEYTAASDFVDDAP